MISFFRTFHLYVGGKVRRYNGVVKCRKNRRRTENTIAKRQRTKNHIQNITQKTKDRTTRPHK
jgi:hypothetical protein